MRQGTMTAITAPVVVIANNIILILWGQSNDLGFGTGDPADSKYNDPNPNARILGDDYVWRVLSFPSNNKGVTVGEDDGFGAELSVAYNMMDQDDIRIVKYGKGATDIANDWAVGTALKLELINQINIAILAYPNHDIHFYHNQYEKDVANAQRSADYYDNCVLFYNDLEANINGTIKTLTVAELTKGLVNAGKSTTCKVAPTKVLPFHTRK